MRIISDVPVRVGTIRNLNSENDSVSFAGRHKTINTPVIIAGSTIISDELLELVNIFILNKATGNLVDLQPTAKGMLCWLKFIVENNINPFEPTKMKIDSPTHGFKLYLLEIIAKHPNEAASPNKIASSTASSYMNTVKSFYEFLIGNKLVPADGFFEHVVRSTGEGRKVNSSDLHIKVPKTQGPSLRPLPPEKQKDFLMGLQLLPEEHQLAFRMMYYCGLRIYEAATVPALLFDEEVIAKSRAEFIDGLQIGPHNGCHTKFSKKRPMFMTRPLYEQILDYKCSERYEKRLRKWRTNYGEEAAIEPLFITPKGHTYTAKTIYSQWHLLKQGLATQGTTLDHKPHDLRATFATNYLGAALKHYPENVDEAIASVKEWMGHEDESTTMKYIRFLSNKKIAIQVADVMDAYISEIMGNAA